MADVTFTVTVQEPFAGTVAPARDTPRPLLAAVTEPPAQEVVPEAVPVFTRPEGYASVKAAPVTALALPLVSVIVSTLGSPVPMAGGVNVCATERPDSTLSVALAGAVFAPALADVTAPAAIVSV